MSSETIRFTLDGRGLTAQPGESILQAAHRHGIEIPHLCSHPQQRVAGSCRACVVEIDGERRLAPACHRQPVDGMQVRSDSERARRNQRQVLQLTVAELGEGVAPSGELAHWCRLLGVGARRYSAAVAVPADASHPAIRVQLDACIHCNRCLRACREVQVNQVIGVAGRGAAAHIIFDLDQSIGASSCVGCGECVQACPTDALLPAAAGTAEQAEREVESLCPYCGVGCQTLYRVADNRILSVEGRDGPANHSRLCVKGRYGIDYISHPGRLTQPLIRRDDAPKSVDVEHFDPADWQRLFRPASWTEALDRAAQGLRQIRDRRGGAALAGFGSAKGSNEEAYLFQKLIRTGLGTNNVDHCTRLCHASSVAALLQMVGSGAVSNPVADVQHAELILVIGSNTTGNHPVAATFIKNQAQAGKTLIVMDPRRTVIADHADYFLQFKPDSDVALLNAIMQSVIEQGLLDEDFIEQRTEGFDALREHLRQFTAERMAPVCGIAAETIHEVARRYAGAAGAMIFWGMGVSQHVHGTDNARCLISLALMTGQIGRRGTGLHPLRGQNNVQGASDVGLIPMVFPDYQRVDDPNAQAHFARLWDYQPNPQPGLTVVEIMHAIRAGDIDGMYIMGENPAMSDPDLNQSRAALAALQHLVVQDIFLTETAMFADVVLPASAFPEKSGSFTNTDRRVQLGRQAVDPPGEARQDLWIIQQLAQRLGLDWDYSGPQPVFDEMRQAMPSIAGMTWKRLQQQHSITLPCRNEGDPGDEVLFTDRFPTPSGRARFVPAPLRNADELPDADYPWVLITGRQLEHWHTGAMTRRSRVLDQLEPQPVVMLNSAALQQLGVAAGDPVTLKSRRGAVRVAVRVDDGLQQGQLFLPFCYREAAANLLTNPVLDPDGKIPEFKFCAVQIDA